MALRQLEEANKELIEMNDTKKEILYMIGPSTLFRYLYQAGYDWLGAEQMYGPEEIILSSLRGASRARAERPDGGSSPFTLRFMANIFPPNTNKRVYGIAALVARAAAFVLGGIYYVNFRCV